MESGILAVGLTALMLGGAMTLLAWNVVRQNRRRELARTALLSRLAFPGGVPGSAVADPPTDAVAFFPVREIRPESPVATDTLFSKPESLGAVSRHTLALAAIGVVIAFAIGALCGLASLKINSAAAPSAAPVQTPKRVELLSPIFRSPAAFLVTTGSESTAG